MDIPVWTKESIQHLLRTSERAVERAVVQIYRRQTSTEQASGLTTQHNNIGFNAFDAPYLSYIAEWLLSGRSLNVKHLAKTRNKIVRYHRQLLELANEWSAKKIEMGQLNAPMPADPEQEAEARYHELENQRDMQQEMNRMRAKHEWEMRAEVSAGVWA